MADTLQEQRNKLAAEIRSLADRQDKWTDEDRSAWTKVNGEYDAVVKQQDEERSKFEQNEAVQKRLAEIEARQKEVRTEVRNLDGDRRREENPERKLANEAEVRSLALQSWLRADAGIDLTDEHRSACRALGINPGSRELSLTHDGFRYGDPAWQSRGFTPARELRTGMDVATSGKGLETIPQGFMYELERRTLEFAHVRRVCRVIHTPTGNALPWPTVDDTGNTGVLLAEATTIGTSVDPTFAAVTFNAYKYSSKPVFVSYEILRDSAFNLASIIADLLGERLGRIEGSETTSANGSSKPNGIVTAAGTGVTAASATAFTADELIALVHSLDPSYRTGASVGFMMHDNAVLYVRKFKDSTGQYLWQNGLMAGDPDRLIGFPVAVNQSMDTFTNGLPVTAKKHVLFGDYSKYVIRDVATPRFKRLDERYADTDQVAFIAFKELDGDTIQANALKVLLQA